MLGFMKFGGKINFPLMGDVQLSADKLLKQFEKQLLFEGANDIERHGDILTFSGVSFRFRFTCRFLDIINRGFIRVFIREQYLVVNYILTLPWVFGASLAAALLASLVIITTGDFLSSLKMFLLVFTLFFVLNTTFVFMSVQVFIRSVWSAVFRESLFWKILYVLAS